MMPAVLALVAAVSGPGGAVTEAEIRFVEGPGPVPLILSLRGGSALVVESTGLERPVGAYRVEVPPSDPIFAVLSRLPDRISGPPLIPDSAVVWLSLRAATGKRELTAARPSTDPGVTMLLDEVQRIVQKARARPVGTVGLSLLPSGSRTATLHFTTGGRPDVEIRLVDGTPRVEAAPLPAPAAPNVTPLPPEWAAVTGKGAKPLDLRLKGGQQRDVAVPITPERAPRVLRATFTGKLIIREPGQPEMAGPVELTSPPLEGGGR
jgi:hypothetical protein